MRPTCTNGPRHRSAPAETVPFSVVLDTCVLYPACDRHLQHDRLSRPQHRATRDRDHPPRHLPPRPARPCARSGHRRAVRASRGTSDLEIPDAMPSAATRSSTLRADTPCTSWSPVPGPVPDALGRARLGALMRPSTDAFGRLRVDEGLERRRDGSGDHVDIAAGALRVDNDEVELVVELELCWPSRSGPAVARGCEVRHRHRAGLSPAGRTGRSDRVRISESRRGASGRTARDHGCPSPTCRMHRPRRRRSWGMNLHTGP